MQSITFLRYLLGAVLLQVSMASRNSMSRDLGYLVEKQKRLESTFEQVIGNPVQKPEFQNMDLLAKFQDYMKLDKYMEKRGIVRFTMYLDDNEFDVVTMDTENEGIDMLFPDGPSAAISKFSEFVRHSKIQFSRKKGPDFTLLKRMKALSNTISAMAQNPSMDIVENMQKDISSLKEYTLAMFQYKGYYTQVYWNVVDIENVFKFVSKDIMRKSRIELMRQTSKSILSPKMLTPRFRSGQH